MVSGGSADGGRANGGSANAGNSSGGANVGGTATGGGSNASGGKAAGGRSNSGGAATGAAGGTAIGSAANQGGTSLGSGGRGGGAATGGIVATGATNGMGGAGKGGTTNTAGVPATGGANGNSGPAYLPAFIIGADISRVQEQEDSGMTFKDFDGTTPTGTTTTGGGILTILKKHGFNYVRLRIFVNPATSGGYSSSGYCDRDHTVKFATGVKLAGMGLLLDFHYSDTWADPANQNKPTAWASSSFADLTTQVYSYTKDVVTQLKANNGRPDMVQIGNEIPQGLLFDASGAVAGNGGKVSGQQFGNLAALLSAGVRGVKEVDSNIKIMMHLDRCNDNATSTWWVKGVQGAGVQFDILGESCYDRANYQQPTSDWGPNFSNLATSFPNLNFVAAEYSDSKQIVNDTIFNIANKRGLGTFIWEPTNWGEMMFNNSGQLLSQYATLFDNVAATYGKR
jgi:arabinogalactan endo-1,4-beta-galactosidase